MPRFNRLTPYILSLFILLTTIGCNSTSTSTGLTTLTASTLQYDTAGTTITGTITTLNGSTSSTTLSDFNVSITGCTVSTVTVGSTNTVTMAGSATVTSTMTVTLPSSCSATSMTIGAVETINSKAGTFSGTASISLAGTTTSNIVYLTADSSSSAFTVTNNSESHTIKIKAFDSNYAPIQTGTLLIGYPTSNIGSFDIGSINPAIEAPITNGVATFTYTGPSDLLALYNSGARTDTFAFRDKSNSIRTASVVVTYAPTTTTVTPIAQTGYTVSFTNPSGKNTIDIEKQEVFTLVVKDKDGNAIADTKVTDINITANGTTQFKFIDSNATAVSTLNYSSKNNIAIPIQTYTKSGLTAIKIDALIKDDNNNSVSLSETVSLTVFSGLPTAISMSYAGSSNNAAAAKIEEKWVISLADKYDNPVNFAPTIYVGAMSGYAESNGTNSYLVKDAAQASLTSSGGVATLSSISQSLASIDLNNDILITYGNGYSYHASGKWDIASVASTTSLSLKDDYNSTTPVTGLGYAVGHNYRQDACRFGQEWIAKVDSADGTYKVDTNGNAFVTLSYDYYMVGKTIYMYTNVLGLVNSENKTMRLGESRKLMCRGITGTLPSAGVSTVPTTYTLEANRTLVYRFTFNVNGSTESLRNSNINVTTKTSLGKSIINSKTSSGLDLACTGNSGVSYVDINVTAGPDTETLTISDAYLNYEF